MHDAVDPHQPDQFPQVMVVLVVQTRAICNKWFGAGNGKGLWWSVVAMIVYADSRQVMAVLVGRNSGGPSTRIFSIWGCWCGVDFFEIENGMFIKITQWL